MLYGNQPVKKIIETFLTRSKASAADLEEGYEVRYDQNDMLHVRNFEPIEQNY